MCLVSNIADGWRDNFQPRWPQVPLNPVYPIPEITRAEFDALKAEIEDLKKLLQQAREFDKKTGQPDCEMEQKTKFLREIAAALGVDLREPTP